MTKKGTNKKRDRENKRKGIKNETNKATKREIHNEIN